MNPAAPIHIFSLGMPAEAVPEQGAADRVPLPEPLRRALAAFQVLVGGREHLSRLPNFSGERLVVDADLEGLLSRMEANRNAGKSQAVLCSGDGLYFGLGATLLRRFGRHGLSFSPGVSSLQAIAALVGLPWQDVRSVSLHGRAPWTALAHALYAREAVCLLTDARSGPEAVAAYLLERGCASYRMHIAERLFLSVSGQARAERCRSLSPGEALARGETFTSPCTLLLEPLALPDHDPALRCFGLPDASLARQGELITKLPVRATALAALGVAPEHTVWDLGAGSGAVALEAARMAWKGRVVAVERDPKRVAMILENRRLLGVPHLDIVRGALPECLPDGTKAGTSTADPLLEPRPDRIFLGGGLGAAEEAGQKLLDRAWRALRPGGRMTVSCVLLRTLERARAWMEAAGARADILSVQAGRSVPLGRDVRLEAENPVFLVTGSKRDD